MEQLLLTCFAFRTTDIIYTNNCNSCLNIYIANRTLNTNMHMHTVHKQHIKNSTKYLRKSPIVY